MIVYNNTYSVSRQFAGKSSAAREMLPIRPLALKNTGPIREGFTTYCDGHHDGWVVGRDGQFPLSANALSGWVFLNNLH